MKAEELVGVEGRQQPGPGTKANTVLNRGREGGEEWREEKSPGNWSPSP